MAGGKLGELTAAGVTALALVCPFCNVMFEGQQKAIAKRAGLDIKVPVVYLTQILGLALGFTPDEMGFKLNRAKPKELLEAFK
jgi:heterodisulfide reductase subunit B